MRKLIVTSLLVLAIVGVAGLNVARAETMTNDTYNWLVHVKNVCGKCADKCGLCKDKCEPSCKPACEPKCEKACKPKCEPCKPKCESKCKPCCPKLPCEYPDPCRGAEGEMSRDGLSRQNAH